MGIILLITLVTQSHFAQIYLPVATAECPYITQAIVLDGKASEISWSAPHQVEALNRVTGDYDGPSDLSGFFQTAYDLEAFYIFLPCMMILLPFTIRKPIPQ